MIDNVEEKKIFLVEDSLKNIYTKRGKSNLIIEADNLYGLLSVKDGYKGIVDLIYIDPPYNTGNSGFAYKDSFNHKEWVAFMDKRLRVAREFLNESGVIYISIDDSEIHRLRFLMDDIFGEQNFVATLIWENKYTISNDNKCISTITEYILCYAKNKKFASFSSFPLREEYVKKSYRYNDNDGRGPYRLVQLYKKKNPKKYKVVAPNGKIWEMPWNYSETSWKKLEEDNMIYWGKDGNACPSKKVFLSNSKGIPPRNLLLGERVGFQQDGGKEIENIFGDRNVFLYPKPTSLIKHIISLCPNKDAVVLDFFAGSGTTGQAVLEKNKEDKGNRKFILITSNDNNICEKICYERVKRVIEGYVNKNNITIGGISDNLKYYKVVVK